MSEDDTVQAEKWKTLLDPDERIIWHGKPTLRTQLDVPMLFVAAYAVVIMCLAFSGLPLALDAFSSSPGFSIAFFACLALMVLFALFLFPGFLILVRKMKMNCDYMLTQRRAVVVISVFGRNSLRSYPIMPDTVLTLVEGSTGSVFVGDVPIGLFFKLIGGRGFEQIEDARTVYNLMRQVQNTAE